MKHASFLDDADSKLVPTNWLLMRPRSRSERFFAPHGWLQRITESWNVKSNLKLMSEQVFALVSIYQTLPIACCPSLFPASSRHSLFFLPVSFYLLFLAHSLLISLVSLFPTASCFPPLVPLLPFPRRQQSRRPGSLIALGDCC